MPLLEDDDLLSRFMSSWKPVSSKMVKQDMERCRDRLLSLSPLDQGSQASEVHTDMFKSVAALYNKDISIVAFLVADNCSTNQRIVTLLEVPLVTCAI
ncbi:hypothetical protein PHMEG_00023221 [Phytophthora megakarya]|uniref:Uncharacterized protein n=1 Tax=Phytophthora megakarya TaxID=4795 RepID=A0A225VJV8_9STRA|nr:hypothetical protein PHMEG_00023221 [Phytophthora megakarya]